jgi:hypothetical protein
MSYRLVRHNLTNCIGQIICDTTNHTDGSRSVLVMWQDGTDDAIPFAELSPFHKAPRRRELVFAAIALAVFCIALDFLPYL